MAAHATPSDWNRPTDYERWYASSLGQAYRASLERVLAPWLAEFAGALILDIGCGPGLLERLFPADAEVVGLDCSLEMAQRASSRWREAGVPRRFAVGSAEAMPFGDASFDLAFCVNCLEFVEDRKAALAEIARVLRPQGTAILGMLNRRSAWEVTRRLRRPFTGRAYYRGRFWTRQEIESFCRQAGLAIRDVRTTVHFPPIPPGPLLGAYQSYDRWRGAHRPARGGVLLCRAVKP